MPTSKPFERDRPYDAPYSTSGDHLEDDDPTDGPISTSKPTASSSEKNSVLDELLPLPTTTLEPSSTTTSYLSTHLNLLHSLRRVTSLSIIIGFVLGIAYIASTSPAVDGSIRRAETAWGRFTRLHGKVFEDVGSDRVKGDSGMQVEVGSEAEQSEGDGVAQGITQGTLGDELDDEGMSVEEYVWGDSDPIVDEPGLDLDLSDEGKGDGEGKDGESSVGGRDWARYTFLRTLGDGHVDTSVPGKRVIFVGDVHGMYDNLQKLLIKIQYDASKDFLIHVGDLVAKGPDPLKVLKFMRKNRVRGVRGNHDEKVVEWRNWMVWAGTKDAERRRAERGEEASSDDIQDDDDPDSASWRQFVKSMDWQYGADPKRLHSALSTSNLPFPKSWEWRSEHWKIARDMGKKEYDYLVSLPLALHIPSIHSVVVHAGLLGRDPTKLADAADQPYSNLFDEVTETDPKAAPMSRHQAELDVFTKIKQNRRPYTLMNIRSVLKDGRVTKKSNKGTPWSDIWQQEQARCAGPGRWALGEVAEDEDETVGVEHAGVEMVEDMESRGVEVGLEKRKKHVVLESLPRLNCSPLTVIYGHAAGRGLDIKQFSKGLDSGCVYGHRMTALVLGDLTGLGVDSDSNLNQTQSGTDDAVIEQGLGKKGRKVRVGNQKGMLVDVGCPKEA